MENEVIDFSQILRCALDIGEMLLKSGAEVSRVEDTISRICNAYGAERVDVLTITSSIVVTVIKPGGEVITQTRRILGQSRDMTRLDALNRLSRDICHNKPDCEWIRGRIDEISKLRGVRWYVTLIASLAAACGFTVFFGGTWIDGLATVTVASAIFLIEYIKPRVKINKILYFILISFVSGLVSIGTVRLLGVCGVTANVNAIMIGAIMLLIPGVAITSAFEDLLSGDTITGLLRLCESILLAVVIALGFALATFVCGAGDLLDDGKFLENVKPYVRVISGAVASGGFAILFGVRKIKRFATAVIIAGLTQLAWEISNLLIGSGSITGINEKMIVPLFVAAFFGEALSQIMARIMHTPATVFSVPAIVPLVPGSALYYTMSHAFLGNTAMSAEKGMETVFSALSIAFGLVIAMFVATLFVTARRHIKLKRKTKTK